MYKIIFTLFVVAFCAYSSEAQYHHHYVKTEQEQHHKKPVKHVHDADTPDPSEEARELKKMQRHAQRERTSEQLEKDKQNIKYEKNRYKKDKPVGIYDGVSKAGIRQHKRKLREDKRKSS